MIRKMFQSPSVHFALVCGAKGCPVLRKEPYTAARLEEQFAEQARAFLGDEDKNFVELTEKELHLSPIFKWYGEDFGKDDAAIIQFVADFFPPETAEALRDRILSEERESFEQRLNRMWMLGYSRLPTGEETRNMKMWIQNATNSIERRDAWKTISHAVLSSNEFLYID